MLLVGVDDRPNKLVPNDVFVVEINEPDPGHILECLQGLAQARAFVRWEIDLGAVTGHDTLRARADASQEHALYFSRCPIPFARDAAFPAKYFRHQGIYGYRRELLLRFVRWKPSPMEKAEALEQLRALENGVNIHVVVTERGSPGVDTPDDARAVENQLLAPPRRPRQARSR